MDGRDRDMVKGGVGLVGGQGGVVNGEFWECEFFLAGVLVGVVGRKGRMLFFFPSRGR